MSQRTYVACGEAELLAKQFVKSITLGMIALETVNSVISRATSDSSLACVSDAAGISLHLQEGGL